MDKGWDHHRNPNVQGLYDMGNLAAVCRSADAFGLASVHCIKDRCVWVCMCMCASVCACLCVHVRVCVCASVCE